MLSFVNEENMFLLVIWQFSTCKHLHLESVREIEGKALNEGDDAKGHLSIILV